MTFHRTSDLKIFRRSRPLMPVLYGGVPGSNSRPRTSAPTITGSKPASRTSRAAVSKASRSSLGQRYADAVSFTMRLTLEHLEVHRVQRLHPPGAGKHCGGPTGRTLGMPARLPRCFAVTLLVGIPRIQHDLAHQQRRNITRKIWNRCQRNRQHHHFSERRTLQPAFPPMHAYPTSRVAAEDSRGDARQAALRARRRPTSFDRFDPIIPAPTIPIRMESSSSIPLLAAHLQLFHQTVSHSLLWIFRRRRFNPTSCAVALWRRQPPAPARTRTSAAIPLVAPKLRTCACR